MGLRKKKDCRGCVKYTPDFSGFGCSDNVPQDLTMVHSKVDSSLIAKPLAPCHKETKKYDFVIKLTNYQLQVFWGIVYSQDNRYLSLLSELAHKIWGLSKIKKVNDGRKAKIGSTVNTLLNNKLLLKSKKGTISVNSKAKAERK